MRIVAISNIHGYYDQFITLLNHIKFDFKKDKLVVMGGLLDFGPKSVKVIEKCIDFKERGAIILRGEVEQMYINAYCCDNFQNEERIYAHDKNLGFFYSDNIYLKDKHLEFFQGLDLFYENDDYIFSHAGLDPTRLDVSKYLLNKDFPNKDCSQINKKIVFGNNPIPFLQNGGRRVFTDENKIGIDFGAKFRKALGVVVLEDKQCKHFTISLKR